MWACELNGLGGKYLRQLLKGQAWLEVMGLGSLLRGVADGVTLGGMDMSILSTIPLPDAETQQKYEAMGLPDPVAFAALTALGAIPDPMAMLNAMMLKAERKIEADASATVNRKESVPSEPPAGAENGVPDAPRPVVSGPEPPPVKFKLPGMAEGKSFVEAFKELEKAKEIEKMEEEQRAAASSGYVAAAARILGAQEDHLAKQAHQAAEQAKVAADRAREVAAQSVAAPTAIGPGAGWAAESKGVAQVFTIAADDDAAASSGRPAAQTLSALLGSQQSSDGYALGAPAIDKICISRLPRGITDAAIRLECARHGAVTSVILQGDGSAAYVTYATSDMAANAMRRILGRPGALGSSEPLEVHLIGEIPENVRLAPAALAPEVVEDPPDFSMLPEYLRPKEDRKKEKRSKSREKSRSRSRRKKRSKSRSKSRRKKRKEKTRNKSRDRWLDRSRSHSHTATGQYIRATGCTSSVRPWQKKRKSSSSSRSRSQRRREPVAADEKRPRQVAVKDSWAQFTFKGNSYYYNIQTGQTQWDRPKELDTPSSTGRRYREAPAATAPNLQNSKSAAGCLL